ncbi:hypothetical protein ABZ641_11600, partial [Kitasatospora sp. NPDC007106]
MTWTLTNDPAALRAEAGAFLAAHPADNTVLLTLLDRIAKRGRHAFGDGEPVFGHWRAAPDGPVAGVFAQTPPYPVRLGRMPADREGTRQYNRHHNTYLVLRRVGVK